MCNIRYAQVIYRLNTNVCVVFPEKAPNQLALFGVKKSSSSQNKGHSQRQVILTIQNVNSMKDKTKVWKLDLKTSRDKDN